MDGDDQPEGQRPTPGSSPGRGAGRSSAGRRCRPVAGRPGAAGRGGHGAVIAPPPARGSGVVLVVAQEQLLQRRRRADAGCATPPRPARAARRRARRCRPGSGPGVPSTVEVVDAGQRAPARRAAPASSAVTLVRVRCRRSASEPVSTVRPARMMLTRSHSASTSERMWLDEQHGAAAVALLGRCSCWKTASISGSRPEVGSSRISSSTSEASAATRATFCRLPLE